MDSLLSSYASDDDEDAPAPAAASKRLSAAAAAVAKPSPSSALFSTLPAPKTSAPSSLFSTLPPPKPSPSPSLFSDLPRPKASQSSSSSSSLFSFLPPPKPAPPLPTIAPPKPVVKFTPPITAFIPAADSDDEDTSRKRKPHETPAPKSSSLVLPAPKNTLGLTPALGAARRSALESAPVDTAVAEPVPVPVPVPVPDGAGYENYGGYEGGVSQPGYSGGGEEGWVQGYAGDWPEEHAVTTNPDLADMARVAGKRARRGVPMEIVEVKQDELMKNRPREDKHKATGIAFGPAYQPVSSGKEKPSKLHKRKHQIGSLYFDMKQKEMELAERRSRGFLTKAETQAKYGW